MIRQIFYNILLRNDKPVVVGLINIQGKEKTDSVNVKYFSNEHALGQLTQYLDNNWTSNWTICARARSDLSINVQVFSAHSFWRNCYKCFCSAEANKGFLLTCNGVDHKCFCGPLQAIVVQVFLYRQGQTSTLADRCEGVC